MRLPTDRLRKSLETQRALAATRAGRTVMAVVALLMIATIVALVAMWPSDVKTRQSSTVVSSFNVVNAVVESVSARTVPSSPIPAA